MDKGFSYTGQNATQRTVSLRMLLFTLLGSVVLGAVAMFFLLRPEGLTLPNILTVRSDEVTTEETPTPLSGSEIIAEAPEEEQPQVAVKEAIEAVERVEQVVEQAGGIDQRVAAMEQRLTRLDLQSQAAAGDAARAEGLLIAFAARRSIDRGEPLGYLEDQLRIRFGVDRPNAVQTVINAGDDPVTLEQLIARLDGLASELTDTPRDEGLMSWLGNELSQLFVVRTDDTPSPIAARRLERARLNLETGRVEFSVNEVRNLPNASAAESWIEDAERYAAAQRALETLEAVAILGTRELRDGSGEVVETPGAATQ